MLPANVVASRPALTPRACTMPAVMDRLIRIVVNALALIAAVVFVPGLEFEPVDRLVAGDVTPDVWKIAVVALIFGLVNSYIRPIVKLVALPVSLFTLGIVGFLVNAGMLMLTAFLSGQLDLGFTVAGWPGAPLDADVIFTAVLASIVISIVSTLMGFVRLIVPGI